MELQSIVKTGLVGAILLIGGCTPTPSIPPTPTKTPVSSVADQPAPTLPTQVPTISPATQTPLPATAAPTLDEPTLTPTESDITLTPTDTLPPPTPDDGLPADHYWMARPIPEGWADYADRTYAYGNTAGGQYRPHAGVDMINPASTPVVAVANATVFHAGTDWETQFGPQNNFYGNLIVLQLDGRSYNGGSVYALYGHLSEVYVEVGDTVPQGEIIGAVGGTGVANGGAHLHFEVRVGDPYSYAASTRNPDLWIRPYFGYGTLAGRVVDGAGNRLPEVSFTIRGVDAIRYMWSYKGSENISDSAWGENFTYGDLPEGWYTVTTRSSTRSYSQDVYIRAGRTAWVEFIFN